MDQSDPYREFEAVTNTVPVTDNDYSATYETALEQRDDRTPLTFKNMYLALAILTMAFGATSLGGGFYVKRNCQAWADETARKVADAEAILFYVTVGMLAVVMAWAILLLVRWKWTWMSMDFIPGRLYGDDVEDFDRGRLAAEGLKIDESSREALRRVRADADIALSGR